MGPPKGEFGGGGSPLLTHRKLPVAVIPPLSTCVVQSNVHRGQGNCRLSLSLARLLPLEQLQKALHML